MRCDTSSRSPESLRFWQPEYGAEIGRAVVSFDGPMVFCVVSRYHGGAFVVFSSALNPNLEIAALEGTYASVIGGAPAAAVVFAREGEKRTVEDPEVQEIDRLISKADGAERARLRVRRAEIVKAVQSARLGEVADEFDRVHSVHRALEVGSVHHTVPPARLRPYLIEAVERGMDPARARSGAGARQRTAVSGRGPGPQGAVGQHPRHYCGFTCSVVVTVNRRRFV